jgi:pimeloyl-ACP methyl ester carboxylesterase
VPEDLETRYARFVRDVPRRTETIDGVPWAWRETGSGSTALVVLPGAIGGAGVFFVLFQELSPLIRVVGIDVPFVADAALTLKQLDALLESRGVEHAVFLGASFSGLLVQAYSRTYPGRTRALILSQTGPIDSRRAAKERAYARRAAKIPAVLLRGTLRLVVRLILRRTPERRFWMEQYDRALAPLTREAMVSRYALAASIDELSGGPPWAGDVLIIHSDNDSVAKPVDQQRLREVYPNARWHEFTGAGHSAYSQAPLAYAAVIRDFVGGLLTV